MAEKGTGDSTGLENILQCQLCHKKLKAPLTLKQCLHSFCISCAEAIPKKTIRGNEGVFCPKCKTFSRKDEIETNFFLASLVDANNNGHESNHKAVICEQCKGDSKVSGKCLDCKMALCEKCKRFHLNIPMLKGHKIIRLAHDIAEVIDDLTFCPIHQDRVHELNCKPCGKVICMVCKATGHESHKTEFIVNALESIDSNTAQISQNVEAMKAQIECIRSKIEKTKEDFRSCRLKMDNHLEKVISRIQATKAKVEDEVTEQESVALGTLDGIKQNLENQLSEATNIVNLVSAAKGHYKDVSLLTTLHGGLYGKVNNLGEKEQPCIDVNIPEVNFTESVNIEATFKEVFGDVHYEVESSVIHPSVQILEFHNICHSFEGVFDNTFTENLTIDLPSLTNRFSYIDDQIWVPLNSKNLISVYNMQGELIKSVHIEKGVRVVKKAHNGDIIAGGDGGLYVVSNDWSEWSLISEGKFCDIIIHRNTFSALDYYKKKIGTFSYSTSDIMWTETQKKSVEDIQNCAFDTISSCGDAFVVSGILERDILEYNKDGDFIKSKSFESEVCFAGTDKSGKILTTNFRKGTLHVLDISGEELSLQSIGDIKCPKLRDVIIDREKNIWCLRGNNGEYGVVKFVMKK